MEPQLSFEAAYAELEATVQQLETGHLSLAEALALYERGVQLARLCARQLNEAELRVQQLTLATDEDVDEDTPFAAADEEDEPF